MTRKTVLLWIASLCLGSAPAQLQDSPWPMFHHDLQHTGRSPYVGPEMPTLKWTYETGSAVNSSAAVGADGTVYVGCCNDTLYAINPDGTLRWSFSTGGNIWSSPAIGADGTVYVGSVGDYSLYAIDSTGSFKWSYTTGYHIYSSPAIGPDGTIYIGASDFNLYAINPDGTLKWSHPTGGAIYSSPAVGADSTIYVGSDDCNLYAINPGGTLEWTYPMQGLIRSSPAIASDGTIYINPQLDDIGLYAINPDGTLKWHCDTLGLIFGVSPFTSSPAIDRDGVIYVGSWALFAINPDGTLKWVCPTPGAVDPCSPAVDADKTVYIGCPSRHVYAVDSTGTLKWDFPTPEGDVYTSPAIDDRRTIYVGTAGEENSEFFAIGFSRDVSPIAIISPGDSVCVDSTYSPQAVVKNLGDTLETFDVECIIDTVGEPLYWDTSTVLSLAVGDTAVVTFDNWTVGPDPGVTYTVTVVTLLAPDYRPANDTLSKVTVSILPPGVEEQPMLPAPPEVCSLSQNYPNPVGTKTNIRYGLGSVCQVRLNVHDVTGRLLRNLVNNEQKPGFYTVRWDGRDSSGRKVSSGIYFYRLVARQTHGPPKERRTSGRADDAAVPFELGRAQSSRSEDLVIDGSGAGVPALSGAEVFTATKKLVMLR